MSLHLHLIARWLSAGGLPKEPSGQQKFGNLGRQTRPEPLCDSPNLQASAWQQLGQTEVSLGLWQ